MDEDVLVLSGEQTKAARIATGMTIDECAARFGYSRGGWEKKENPGPSHRPLSPGECELLLLLAKTHPVYRLVRKPV